jgi:hypothetical protein
MCEREEEIDVHTRAPNGNEIMSVHRVSLLICGNGKDRSNDSCGSITAVELQHTELSADPTRKQETA